MAASTAHASVSAPRSAATGLVLPGDRPAEVVAFEVEMVDFFVAAADLLGVPKSVAAIYGTVFASPVPLSFAEIEARLDISKGSVSQGLRVLREVGALRAAGSQPGAGSTEPEAEATSRGILYEPDLELRKLIGRFIENRVEKQLGAGSSKLTALHKAVPGSPAEAAELKRRLKSLSDWHSKARSVLPIVRGLLKVAG